MFEPIDRRRRWLEVVVIFVCVGVLIGLLLPSVQSTRIAERRARCANNLKNLALATLNFEGIRRRYPGFQQEFARLADGQSKFGTWTVSLMPILEQQALRDIWDDPTEQNNWEEAIKNRNASHLERFYPTISLFMCPGDLTQASPFAPMSYAANAGFYLSPNDPALALAAYESATTDSERSTISQRSANGIFANGLSSNVYDPSQGQVVAAFGTSSEKINSAAILDGTSQTIVFVESANNLNWKEHSIADDSARYKVGCVWQYADQKADSGRPQPATVKKPPGKLVDIRFAPERARPSSFHSYGVNIAMVDGSVKLAGEEMDYVIYQSLMCPDNSQSDMPRASYSLKRADWER